MLFLAAVVAFLAQADKFISIISWHSGLTASWRASGAPGAENFDFQAVTGAQAGCSCADPPDGIVEIRAGSPTTASCNYKSPDARAVGEWRLCCSPFALCEQPDSSPACPNRSGSLLQCLPSLFKLLTKRALAGAARHGFGKIEPIAL